MNMKVCCPKCGKKFQVKYVRKKYTRKFPSHLEWKEISAAPGFLISRCGKVWNIKKNKYKKSYVSHGYLTFWVLGKRLTIHKSVAIAFVPGQKEGLVVNHKDGNKLNNDPENLEWITNFENLLHARDNGLMSEGCFGAIMGRFRNKKKKLQKFLEN
jgi:hypothetical protein